MLLLQVVERVSTAVDPERAENYAAFYSSTYGGITTNPGLMFIPIDDHFVHKGHGVYENVLLKEGYLYMLDRRVENLKQSCAALGLAIPYTDAALKRIILDTAAASRKKNGKRDTGERQKHQRVCTSWLPLCQAKDIGACSLRWCMSGPCDHACAKLCVHGGLDGRVSYGVD